MRLFLAVVLLALFVPAYSQTPAQDLKGIRVNLDAQASAEVDNDVMRATLFIEMEDVEATRLADKVNRATNAALKTAKEFSGLRVNTAGYSTYPWTDTNHIVHWRSRSEIGIEGEDFRTMAEAIGKLQAAAQLGSITFSVSPALRAKTSEALIQRAIDEFLRKAELVRQGFKGGGFSVLEANVSSGNRFPTVQTIGVRGFSAINSDSEPVAPTVAAGIGRITVTVSGAILIPY